MRKEYGLGRAEPHDAVRRLRHWSHGRSRQHQVRCMHGRQVRTRVQRLPRRMVSKRHCPCFRSLFPMHFGRDVPKRILELRDVRSRHVRSLVRRRVHKLFCRKIPRRSRRNLVQRLSARYLQQYCPRNLECAVQGVPSRTYYRGCTGSYVYHLLRVPSQRVLFEHRRRSRRMQNLPSRSRLLS